MSKPSSPVVAVLGSSVAEGHGGSVGDGVLRGWAWYLKEALRPSRVSLVNLSLSGADTTVTLGRFSSVMKGIRPPTVIIISLSLANEGLPFCHENQETAICEQFVRGITQISKRVTA